MSIVSAFVRVILFAVVLIVTAVVLPVSAQMFHPGETLEYEVSYFGIKLGTVKVITEEFTTYQEKPVVKATAYIDSRSGIPFVSLHTIYHSTMDKSRGYAYAFNASTQEDDNWKYDKYIFDYADKKITLESGVKDKLEKSVVIQTPRKWNDGLSLFFFARMFLNSKRYVSVPTIIEFDTVKTLINFTGEKKTVDIEAVDYDIKTVYLKGDANWTGVYGLTGKFEGWFSDDEACVPISAKMKVYVGNVDIELVKWKRGNWSPPRAE